jgi:glycosyltransferase involved in cell wall biosynthesis
LENKKTILFQGWTGIEHSYSIVNCNQILALYKNYNSYYNFVIDQVQYPDIYKHKWKKTTKLIYSKEDTEILNSITKWNKTDKIDLIYRISYPYNLTMENQIEIDTPKIVFFTAEFAQLDPSYFNLTQSPRILDDEYIKAYLNHHNNFTFTSPSNWSKSSLLKYNKENETIPHGIDQSIFKIDSTLREAIRLKYHVKEDDLLFLHIGSMTGNKGILEILIAITILVCRMKITNIKLMLKGTGELYSSKAFISGYFKNLIEQNIITLEEQNYVLKNNILFFENTLSFKGLNDIYNCADVYLSPYKAEGFNLTVLEALATNLNVIVSDNGSTSDFVNATIDKIGKSNSGIYLLPTQVKNFENGKQLEFDVNVFIKLIYENLNNFKIKKDFTDRMTYIHENWSWTNTANKLHLLFKKLI